MSEIFAGIDLGGTNVKIGIFDAELNLLQKVSIATDAENGPQDVVNRIRDAIHKTLQEQGIDFSRLAAAGIGTPGPVDLKSGIILGAPNMPKFKGCALRKLLTETLGRPAVMENDANAAAWGEFVLGAARDVSDMVFLTLGTGIGGGVVCGGELVHGSRDGAAELGHIIIYPDGERVCGCGQHGCAEAYASANSTAARAEDALRVGGKSTLEKVLGENGSLTSRDIYEHAAAGDALAYEITEGTAKVLGLLCVNILHFTEPRRIVFAGGMIAAGDALLGRIRHYFDKYIWPMKPEPLEICFATLGEDAGIVGNASLAQRAWAGGEFK